MSSHAGMSSAERPPLHRVAVVVDEGVSPFELAVPCEVFGIDRTPQGLPGFDFTVCAPHRGPLRASTGFAVIADHDLAPVAEADLAIVPPTPGTGNHPHPAVIEALHAALSSGARVAALCAGAFVLARAGLLAGRRATTHWMHASALAREHPDVDLVPDVLYVADGPILTSAGTAAAIDLCLHLVRESHGAAAAAAIARRMVVPPHRDGGQAQYVETPVTASDAPTLSPLLEWAGTRLDQELSVERLAARAAMSPRTFARRFRAETGTTPYQWVLAQRLALAERLLETTDVPVEEIARRTGFGSATMLRHHFSRARGTAPTRYRRLFAT